jgi:hypothetical protein
MDAPMAEKLAGRMVAQLGELKADMMVERLAAPRVGQTAESKAELRELPMVARTDVNLAGLMAVWSAGQKAVR